MRFHRRLFILISFIFATNSFAQSNHTNVAVLQDDGTLVAPANAFDLSGKSLTFTPQDGGYTAQLTASTFDQGAGNYVVLPLADDDSIQINLPFAFSFYGTSYSTAFVNTDGSVSFGAADFAATNRTLNRVVKGPPRIAALFDDLITSQGGGAGFVGAEAFSDRVNVYWIGVVDYPAFAVASFEIILQKNGVIKVNYSTVTASNAVVGISPGNSTGVQAIDFSQQTSASTATRSTLGEVFSTQVAIDLEAIGQNFYASHPDSYDSLMVFTDFDINIGAVAYSASLRNKVQGILPSVYTNFDFGSLVGSASRLSILVNGGAVGQYPADPNEVFSSGRSTMTVLAQQFGHRWLSYADVNPTAMLRPNSSNWSFLMNAFGSVMEGNEIVDRGDGTYKTTAAKYRYSPLDQYLMGLRAPEEVPPWFVISSPTLISAPTDFSCSLSAVCTATADVVFSGTKRDITIQDVMTTMGARNPAYPDAQKDFSVAFLLITKNGQVADAGNLAHLDAIRSEWEKFFAKAVDNRGTMTTTLQSVGISTQLSANGSIRTETASPSASGQVGYGVINTGAAVALLRSFSGSDLVSEAAVPPTSAATRWIMYAEKDSAGLSTGVAIANPGKSAANLTLTLNDGRQTTLQLAAGGQRAAFVDELFAGLAAPFLGTLTVQSDVPVAILALRGIKNKKNQFIISTIPLSSSAPEIGGFAAFPMIADGGGYNTELILVNSGSTTSNGTIGFSVTVATDQGTKNQFAFSIPPGGVWRLRTQGAPALTVSGYAAISVDAGAPMPSATALLRLTLNGDLSSETAVPAQSQLTKGLMFGSREANQRTGIAILNPNAQAAQITLTPLDASGVAIGVSGSLTLDPFTQRSAFLDEFVSNLPLGFQGTVLLQSAAPIFAISLRGTTDSHGGFLMSTLPVVDLNQTYSGARYFPQVVDGGGFTTEFLVMNAGVNLVQLNFFNSAGQAMAIVFK